MALSISQTVALGNLLKPGMRIASMGYPDIIAPMDTYLRLFSNDDGSSLEYRNDSAAICKRHGLEYRLIPDADSFFRMMNCELDVYDIVRERGCEIVLDLNGPMGPGPQYDVVLDVGTLEHCMNIGQAAINMAVMVKVGGHILHENPFNWGNHGLYNLNPTWYHDFYTPNGFKLLQCRLVRKDGTGIDAPPTERFVCVEEELNVFAVAQRLEVRPMVFAMQSKYAKMHAKLTAKET